MPDIISTLTYLGITHDRALPFLVLIIAMVAISYKATNPIKKSVRGIKNAIIEIQTIMAQSGATLRHHLLETPGSPVAPTEYGRNLIVESGLEKILNDRTDFLKAELQKKLPISQTDYDVQESARALLLELKANEIMNPVKKYAFDNGIDVDLILRVGGLWLRDDFLGRERTVHSVEKGN
jgi:hypothetical protein